MTRLQELNNDLYSILSHIDDDSLAQAVASYVVAAIREADQQSLKAIQNADSGSSSLIALTARLKELRSQSAGSPKLGEPEAPDSIFRRHVSSTTGIYQISNALDRPVWFEWRYSHRSSKSGLRLLGIFCLQLMTQDFIYHRVSVFMRTSSLHHYSLARRASASSSRFRRGSITHS